MPANVVSIENNKKHLTKKEIEERVNAEKNLSRQSVKLTPPPRLKEDPIAHQYWKTTIKRMRGISLLDDVDVDMLAIYCQLLSRRDILIDCYMRLPNSDNLRNIQAQERLIVQYADKLGLTPQGRARLSKKRAEPKEVDPNADLFD